MIGDFRAPNVIRFGIAPLCIGEADVLGAVSILEKIIATRSYDRPEFRKRAAVT